MVNALLALLICQLAGEVLARAGNLPVPGPVLGLGLLLVALALWTRPMGSRQVGRRPFKDLEQVSNGLLSHLSLLFVPAGVGVMVHVQRIKADWLPLLVALVVSTVLTIAVTALVFRLVERAVGQPDPDASPDAGDGA